MYRDGTIAYPELVHLALLLHVFGPLEVHLVLQRFQLVHTFIDTGITSMEGCDMHY